VPPPSIHGAPESPTSRQLGKSSPVPVDIIEPGGHWLQQYVFARTDSTHVHPAGHADSPQPTVAVSTPPSMSSLLRMQRHTAPTQSVFSLKAADSSVRTHSTAQGRRGMGTSGTRTPKPSPYVSTPFCQLKTAMQLQKDCCSRESRQMACEPGTACRLPLLATSMSLYTRWRSQQVGSSRRSHGVMACQILFRCSTSQCAQTFQNLGRT